MERRPIKDDHHPFHYCRYWEEYEPAKHIRRSIIARDMARVAHDILHIEAPAVPPISFESAKIACDNMSFKYKDVFEGIDDFCFAMDTVNENSHICNGEREYNQLVVHSLRLQIPYLKEGLAKKKIIVPVTTWNDY